MQAYKKENQFKRTLLLFVMGYLILGSLFLTNAHAETKQMVLPIQVFIDDYNISHIVTEDDRTYIQLRELAHVLNYEIDFDEYNNIVSLYKKAGEKPDIKRESSLYPTNIEELVFDDAREIIKVYELEPYDNPREIDRDSFEKNGFSYTFSDMTKSSDSKVDTKEHVETIEINTSSKDMEAILSQLESEMYFELDGYTGTLILDMNSIKTEVAGKKTSSFTVSENREYPNLSNADTSLVPKTIEAKGRTLKLANVDWRSTKSNTVDHEEVAETYTAIATYTGTGSKTNVTGYITTANYTGDISKTLEGKTIYTAYFEGKEINQPEPEPEPEPTIEELETELAKLKAEEKANRKGISINPFYIIAPIGILGVIILLAYLLFLRNNTIIYSLVDGEFKRIGKVRLKAKKPIIDLSQFTSEVVNPDFRIVLEKGIAKKLDDEVLTINYGDNSLQHLVNITSDDKDYELEVKF